MGDVEDTISMKWGEQFGWREKVHKRYPEIWDLPIVRKRVPLVLKYLKDGESVLEIGAFNRALGERLRQHRPRLLYKSLDIDSTFSHDYSSFEEIQETFDVVLLFEVIEHLDLEAGIGMLASIQRVLNRGGRLIISTPNVYTPGQYWKDVSHRTPYHYEELGGLLLSQQFELIKICRFFNEPFLTFLIKVYGLALLFRVLGIDFARSILFVARKA